MRACSLHEVYRVVRIAGWKDEDALEAVVMAFAASMGDADFQLPTGPEEPHTYRGLFGLSVARSDEADRTEWYDPQKCANEAHRRWVTRGRSWRGHFAHPVVNLTELSAMYRRELGLEVAEAQQLTSV